MQRTVISVDPNALTEYDEWMKASGHGDVLVYWIGDLQFDRLTVFNDKTEEQSEDQKKINVLNALADRIRSDARRKEVALTQKRLGEMKFEYRATRRRLSFGKDDADPARPHDAERALA
jgi:hypothetical protein